MGLKSGTCLYSNSLLTALSPLQVYVYSLGFIGLGQGQHTMAYREQ